MASDKEGDRSLSGRNSSGDREGTGGGPGGPAGTGRNSGTNSTSGSQGSGTSSSWGGSSTGGGNQGSGTPGSSPGGGWGGGGGSSGSGGQTSGGGGTAMGGMVNTGGGTNRASGGGSGTAMGGMVNTGGGGVRGATSVHSITSATAAAISEGVSRGLRAALGQNAPAISSLAARAATNVPSLGGMVATNIGTPTGFNTPTAYGAPAATPTGFVSAFRPDLGLRPDLNPAVAADARVQAGLARTRAFEHRTTPFDMSVYSKKFGGKTVSGLTDMTLREVIAYQKDRMKGSKAIGAYQIQDIAYAAKLAGISLDAKMSISTQDRLATALASNRVRQSTNADGTVDLDKLARQISKEWASYINPALNSSNYPKNNNAVGTAADTQQAAMDFAALAGVPATATAAAGIDPMTTNTVMPAVGRGVRGSRMAGVAYGPEMGAPVTSPDTDYVAQSLANAPSARPTGVAVPTAAAASFADKYLGTGRPEVVTPASGFAPDFAARRAISGADMASRIGPTINSPPSRRDIVSRTAFNVAQANAADLAASTGYRPGTPVGPSQALAPGAVGAGFSSAIAPQAPATPTTGAPAPDLAARTRMGGISYGQNGAPVTSPETDYVAQSLANAPRNIAQPSQALAPGPIGAGFSSAVAPSIAALGSTPPADVPVNYGPPRDTLAGLALSQTFGDVPGNLPPASTVNPDLAPRTAINTADVAALHTVPNLAEAPKAEMSLAPGKTPPAGDVVDKIAASIYAAAGPGYEGLIVSGKRSPGQGAKNRHSESRAADTQVIETATGHVLSYNIPADRDILNRISLTGARNFGLQGFGGGPGYMGGTATHFDTSTQAQLGRGQDQEWESYNNPELKGALAQARADYTARSIGGTGSSPGQPPQFAGFTNAPAGSPDPAVASGGAFPPAPGAERAAPGTTTTTAAAGGTAPAGTATGPWGAKPEGPIPGQNYPLEPMRPGQVLGATLTKGVAGAVNPIINLLDFGTELFTGRGFIDRMWAATDNGTGGGGTYRGLTGDTASASGRNRAAAAAALTPSPPPLPPATTPIAKVNDVVDKYIEDKTWRPTPAQRWNYEDDTYSEYA